jgi:hypothetical protein
MYVDWRLLGFCRGDVGDSVDSKYGGGASCSGPAMFDDQEYPHSSSVGSFRGGGRGSGGGVCDVAEPGGMGNERWLYCEPRRVDRDPERCRSSVGGRGSCRILFIDCERESDRAGGSGGTGAGTEDEEVAKKMGSDGRRPGEIADTSRGGVDCERCMG